MFMNVAYLNNSTSTVVDNTKPLIVTSCGNYRVKNRSEVVTHRPKGRKDYQLLYIASGKGHFFIHGEEKNGFSRKYYYIFAGSTTGICLLSCRSNRCLLGAFYRKRSRRNFNVLQYQPAK